MGFELIFYFHERNKDGKYKTEEKKELKKKLGSPFEEIPQEQLAATVMSQLARRDIWVVDVDIFEYTKKKISFKESSDGSGVIIKGKKFSLDHAANLVIANEPEQSAPPSQIAPTPTITPQSSPVVGNGPKNLAPLPPVNQKRIAFWATFEPEIHHLNEAKRIGKFTVGKKYPVHRERENPNGFQFGYLWTMSDDSSKVVEVDEKFFMRVGKGLVGDDEVGFSNRDEGPRPRLSFENELQMDPDVVLRREMAKAQQRPTTMKDIPLGDGGDSEELYKMPDLRPHLKNS